MNTSFKHEIITVSIILQHSQNYNNFYEFNYNSNSTVTIDIIIIFY